VVLGLVVVLVNVYVLGAARGPSSDATPDEVLRIASVRRTAEGAIGGGLLLAIVGGVLLRWASPGRPQRTP